ncbi:flagellar hook-basal body protein FliE [Primorskyibacter flagellatus]|uniref:Flagellar hook-basal body protein FliE n=1 Tax=Primorskyibacter flagellatus TaxID=1387277 RepID=A0A917EK62_9RHOB|nr:flagellar hook-basal body complex protein FliE [Primorskyibacter flagellatus]GGE47443.1 flagellar hook-basal body protein FliE [Primorskyibacter flagellatus]
MDIRAMNVARSYDTARSVTEPQPGTGSGAALTRAIDDFATTFREGEATARAAMIGGADPHALVEALAQTELAVETVVTVRDKVVEAYQEILRMPV